MPEPLRSPKQSRAAAKARTHPYQFSTNSHRTARDVGAESSSSLLGAIKSIVTAPLSWLASGEPKKLNGAPDDDQSPKRKVSSDERSGTPPKSKRVRLNSPAREEEELIRPASTPMGSNRPLISLREPGNGVLRTRIMPIDQPQSPINGVEIPLPPSRAASRASMSVEPLDKFAARRSMTRDRSLPPPSPFARAYSVSLTPQPSGATFGPSPRRKLRDLSVPPGVPLAVPPVPTFVRPPSSTTSAHVFRRQASREPSEGPIMSLMSQTRQSLSPVRQMSETNLLSSIDVTPQRFLTKDEKTLATLETYRTALQFPSAIFSEGQRPRKVHVPLPSKLGFDHVPNGKKKRPSMVQPYSTEMSGMRKLLQRRKRELEQEKLEAAPRNSDDVEQDGSHTGSDNVVQIQDEDMGQDKSKDKTEKEMETEKEKEAMATATPVNGKAADALTRTSKAESYIGLRVPTSRLTRTHAPAPRPRNKFSLKDDEEESLTVDELKSFQAKLPPQLLFASMRRMSEAGMQTEAAVETAPRASFPPLPVQPQSFDTLLSRIGPPIQKPPLEFPPQAKVDSQVQADPASEATRTTTAPVATLPFSLGVPKPPELKVSDVLSPFSPGPANATAPFVTRAPINGAASFFSNSKIQFTPPTLPSGALFGVPPASGSGGGKADKEIVATPSATQEQASDAKPSLESDSAIAPLAVDSSAHLTNVSTGTPTPSNSAEAQKPASSFDVKVSSEPSSKSISILGAATKATESPKLDDSTKSPFAINSGLPTPSPSAEFQTVNVAPASAKPVFSFGVPPAATNTTPFVFGRTGGSATEHPDTSTTHAVPFAFGTTPLTPVANKEPLPFAPATTSSPFGAGTNPRASEPVFTGFGTGTTTDPSTPKPAETKLDNGDSMEVADRMDESPTRNGEKKDTAPFSLSQASSTFPPFGTSTGGFTFGQTKPDTGANSTGFPFVSSDQSQPSTSSAFTFGQRPDNTFKFGQGTPARGFGFGAKAPEQSSTLFNTPVNPGPFTATPPATSTGATFSFGQGPIGTAPPAFGQPKQEAGVSTAPSSPFLGPQQTSSPSFMFNVPSGPNAFGGPKPADGTTPSSPSTTTPFQFGQPNSQSSGQANNSQALFNIGSAAATPPRKMKALPTRRPKRP